MRGFLQRNLKKYSPDVKASCYLMLVCPILEYACVAWSPYHQCNIHAIEMVQRHAARYALNNCNRYASVSEMIGELGWPTLESRHNILRTVMMYKIMNKLVDVPTDAILFPSTLQLRGHTKMIQQLSCRVNAYANSFFPHAIKLWNDLPQYLINSPDLHTFREGMYNLIFSYLSLSHTLTDVQQYSHLSLYINGNK